MIFLHSISIELFFTCSTQAVLEDLEHQKQALAKAEDVAKNPKAYGVEDLTDGRSIFLLYEKNNLTLNVNAYVFTSML